MDLNYILIALPMILGGISSAACNVSKTSGSVVNIRPPSYVFGIAWFILYILIGLSWFFASKQKDKDILVHVFYTILNISLCSWVFVYACGGNKKGGVYTLVISIICALWCCALGDLTSKMLLIPLIGWLFLATLINVLEIS